jgi:hypothetical protein
VNLGFLDEKRLAISLRNAGNRQYLVLGTAVYHRPAAGPCELVVRLDQNQQQQADALEMAVVFREEEWQGEILVDTENGCDYRIEVDLQA